METKKVTLKEFMQFLKGKKAEGITRVMNEETGMIIDFKADNEMNKFVIIN